MNELTVFTCADLPEGERDWVFHADLNVVELRRGMELDERLAAIADLQRHWRRDHLRLVSAV